MVSEGPWSLRLEELQFCKSKLVCFELKHVGSWVFKVRIPFLMTGRAGVIDTLRRRGVHWKLTIGTVGTAFGLSFCQPSCLCCSKALSSKCLMHTREHAGSQLPLFTYASHSFLLDGSAGKRNKRAPLFEWLLHPGTQHPGIFSDLESACSTGSLVLKNPVKGWNVIFPQRSIISKSLKCSIL